MSRARRILIAAATATASIAVMVSMLVAPPELGPAGRHNLSGRAVTVVASSSVTTGTEGDDVVAMTPGGWNQFDALGGNDTICLAVPAAIAGGDPGRPRAGWRPVPGTTPSSISPRSPPEHR